LTERVVILGGGGHAKVVVDILEEMARFEIAGYCAPEPTPDGLLGYPWLGADDALRPEREAVFVAIGDNRRRMDCIDSLRQRGFRLINALSPRAVISKHVTLGDGVVVMPGAVINAGARIGDGAIINTNASVDHDCEIRACAHIAPGTALAGWVRVGEGAFLGVGTSVIPRIGIGAWTTVGAGSVVVADLPGSVLALGIPARIKRGNP
jgi:UDP-perosamine 4-acetyltransferase